MDNHNINNNNNNNDDDNTSWLMMSYACAYVTRQRNTETTVRTLLQSEKHGAMRQLQPALLLRIVQVNHQGRHVSFSCHASTTDYT